MSFTSSSVLAFLWRYCTPVLMVTAGLVATGRLISPHSQATLLLLLWAVTMSAWYGGPGPGLVALVLGLVGADYFLLDPTYTIGLKGPVDMIRLAFFTGASLTVVWLAWRRQEAQRDLLQQNEVLQHEIRERQRAQIELEEAHRQLQALAERLARVREDERARVAREVHDVLGQMLMVIRMEAAQLGDAIGDSPNLRRQACAIIEYADEVSQIIQRIATELRSDLLDNFGLTAAIEWEVKEFMRRAGLKGTTELVQVGPETIDKERGLALFRVLQEALTNVARHANASQIAVILSKNDEHLVLTVRDNGKGIEERAIRMPQKLGLLGMNERVRPFGGTVSIQGTRGHGTVVTVTVPIAKTVST